MVAHSRVHDAAERAKAGLRFHERGIARLTLAWDALSSASERFKKAEHPFTGDLDVFGRASLMQLVDATETRFGEERLAALLSLEAPAGWPGEVVARQEAVRDLSARVAFREALAMAGGVLAGEKPDPAPIVAWAEERDEASPGMRRLLPVIAWLQPAVVLPVLAFGPILGLSTARRDAGLHRRDHARDRRGGARSRRCSRRPRRGGRR